MVFDFTHYNHKIIDVDINKDKIVLITSAYKIICQAKGWNYSSIFIYHNNLSELIGKFLLAINETYLPENYNYKNSHLYEFTFKDSYETFQLMVENKKYKSWLSVKIHF